MNILEDIRLAEGRRAHEYTKDVEYPNPNVHASDGARDGLGRIFRLRGSHPKNFRAELPRRKLEIW